MDAKPIPEIPQAQAEEGSLTRRAKLTFVSSFLQQAARFVVGFGVTPIVIRGLGIELYGAWAMLRQSAGYLALSDLRPMGTLKFTLAVRQHIDDVEEKKRQIGAALIVWAFTFPLFITIGIGAIWVAPHFIRTLPQYAWAVRLAMGLMVLSVALELLLSLPANVLRGMNLDYKAMGLNAATILLGGLFHRSGCLGRLGVARGGCGLHPGGSDQQRGALCGGASGPALVWRGSPFTAGTA